MTSKQFLRAGTFRSTYLAPTNWPTSSEDKALPRIGWNGAQSGTHSINSHRLRLPETSELLEKALTKDTLTTILSKLGSMVNLPQKLVLFRRTAIPEL